MNPCPLEFLQQTVAKIRHLNPNIRQTHAKIRLRSQMSSSTRSNFSNKPLTKSGFETNCLVKLLQRTQNSCENQPMAQLSSSARLNFSKEPLPKSGQISFYASSNASNEATRISAVKNPKSLLCPLNHLQPKGRHCNALLYYL